MAGTVLGPVGCVGWRGRYTECRRHGACHVGCKWYLRSKGIRGLIRIGGVGGRRMAIMMIIQLRA